MITCQRATELVSESQDQKLPLVSTISLWLHLRICKACSLFRSQLGLLRLAVKKVYSEKPPELSREAKDRIIKNLNR